MTQERGEPLQAFLTLLHGTELDFDGENVADALWLAQHLSLEVERPTPEASPQQASAQTLSPPPPQPEPALPPEPLPREPAMEQPQVNVVPQDSHPPEPEGGVGRGKGQPFQASAAKALREARGLARALRPLKRRVKSAREQVLDEEATASLTAEQLFCLPVMGPAPERWLEVVLVVEEAPSTFLWERTIREFQALLGCQGAFRNVRVWSLQASEEGSGFQLFAQRSSGAQRQLQRRPRSSKELIDPAGRRVILLVSDCTSVLWRSGTILQLLQDWGQDGLFSILQLLPEWLWSRTTLSFGGLARLSALSAGVPNAKLRAEPLAWMEEEEEIVQIPIVMLEQMSLQQWAKVLAGGGNSRTAGVLVGIEAFWESVAALERGAQPELAADLGADLTEAVALERVEQFQLGASSGVVSRLAGYMAAVPVSPPITDLIRETLLPEATQADVAEVYMSGLMRRREVAAGGGAEMGPRYEFIPAVRKVLVTTVLASQTEQVLDAVTVYLVQRLNRSVSTFVALLMLLQTEEGESALGVEVQAFARFGLETLRQMGGRYRDWVEAFVGAAEETPSHPLPDSDDWPALEAFEFPVTKIVFEDEPVGTVTEEGLVLFEFETVQVDQRGQIVSRETLQAWQWVEDLGDGVVLEMVVVPGGRFLMGSPQGEKRRDNDEGPQHEVTVPNFLLGKYSVTQAQWRRVAQMQPVERELAADPSSFKGDNKPVERVSWHEAKEFCARLSRETGRIYRLPSEAEWEFACRAGRSTPFYFGETITPALANYNGNYTYGDGPKGESRNATTEVGSYPANPFGLYDMHGNVYDWCEDHYHNEYQGAPNDGSAWIDPELNKKTSERSRVLRGGSWFYPPRSCRSAYRHLNSPEIRFGSYGFRVVCVSARTHLELYIS